MANNKHHDNVREKAYNTKKDFHFAIGAEHCSVVVVFFHLNFIPQLQFTFNIILNFF